MKEALKQALGKVVRDAWVRWAKKQPDAKPSWLVEWDALDDAQKEVDQLIGEAVADFVELHYIRHPDEMVPASRLHDLEDRLTDNARVINALNDALAATMNRIDQYKEACRELLNIWDKYNADDAWLLPYITKLQQVANTQVIVGMGAYQAVDFVRLGQDYVELRETAQAAYEGWKKGDDVVGPMNTLHETLTQYPTPDIGSVRTLPSTMGKLFQVQVTSIAITPHVKELVAVLEPGTRVEAVVYEKGKAAITEVSAKLAILNQAVGEFLRGGYYLRQGYGTITATEAINAYNKLCVAYDRLNKSYRELDNPDGDPVGYLTLKVKVLQTAAQEMLNAWTMAVTSPETALDRRQAQYKALESLEAALRQTGNEFRPTPPELYRDVLRDPDHFDQVTNAVPGIPFPDQSAYAEAPHGAGYAIEEVQPDEDRLNASADAEAEGRKP